MSLTLTGAGSAGAGGEPPPPSYEQTAFVSSSGNDGTALMNDIDLPWQTLQAAHDALFSTYGQGTIRLLTDITGGFTSTIIGALTLRGHSSVQTVTGDITASGADAATQNTPGADGYGMTLTSVTLTGSYLGAGGAGGAGEQADPDGLAGGAGGHGSDLVLTGGSLIDFAYLDGGVGGVGGLGISNLGGNGGDGGRGGNASLAGGSSISTIHYQGGNGGLGGDGAGGPGTAGANGINGTITP